MEPPPRDAPRRPLEEEQEQQQRPRSPPVTTTASSFSASFPSGSSSLAYDKEFLRTPPGILMVAEIVAVSFLGCITMFQKHSGTSQPLRMPAIDAGETSGETASGTWPYSPETSQQPSDSGHESHRQNVHRQNVHRFNPIIKEDMFLILGLLVWTLIAGTEYFLYPVFGWVMFVAVFYWVLTLFFLIIYMTMTYTRIPQVPWTTVGLCFNGSAFVLYFIAAIVDACAVSKEPDSHNYNSWAASSFFAFVVTSCYGGNAYFSFVSWRSRTLQ